MEFGRAGLEGGAVTTGSGAGAGACGAVTNAADAGFAMLFTSGALLAEAPPILEPEPVPAPAPAPAIVVVFPIKQ